MDGAASHPSAGGAGTTVGLHEASSRQRMASFDGMRGFACALVVLLHMWAIVPYDQLERTGALFGLFKSGNLGVSMFFVMGGFLVTRGLLDQVQRDGQFDVARFWMRRLIRLGSQLYLLVVVLYVLSLFDQWDSWTSKQTERSLTTVSTFTFNWSLVDNPLGNREDLGHLWYLSVEQQFYFVWVCVLAWFARFRLALAALLAAGIVAITVHRWSVLEDDWFWRAELSTETRADGLLLGALAAIVFPTLRRFAGWARQLTLPLLATIVVLILLSPNLDQYAFLQTQGIVFVLATALLVLGIAVAERPDGIAERILSSPPLTFLGRISFPLYLWHFPVFYASARWATDIDWFPRAIGTFVVLGVVVFVLERWVERPITRWLDRVRVRSDTTTTQPAIT